MTGWGEGTVKIGTGRKIAMLIGIVAAGAATMSTCSPHEDWTKCRMVHEMYDKEPNWPVDGTQYEHGKWIDPSGHLIGFSQEEDSRVYNSAYCAEFMPAYMEETP